MKKISLFIFGLITLLTLNFLPAMSQRSTLDIAGMHQLVSESQSEHKLQVNAKNQQAINSANEQANLTLLEKLKNEYRTLQHRYNLLGTAISATVVSLEAEPMANQIIAYQRMIYALAQKNPAIIALAYQTEIEFAEKAESLLGYILGLTLSIGDINQMKASDRKMLFDYVIFQLSRLQEISGNMLSLLQYNTLASVLRTMNPFQSWIDQDRALAKEIVQNAKLLKQ